MRNTVLRSPNAKYHYSYLFFYKINKGHLLLMYSCVFWFEISDLVVFLAVIVWPLSLSTIQKTAGGPDLVYSKAGAARKPIESQIFSTRGKLLSSLHRSKRLKATHVAGTFPRAMSKYLLSPDTVIRPLDTALVRGQISLYRGWLSQINWNLIWRF